MIYVFWAHLALWILLSLYIFIIQRRLLFIGSRLASAETKLKEKREGVKKDE